MQGTAILVLEDEAGLPVPNERMKHNGERTVKVHLADAILRLRGLEFVRHLAQCVTHNDDAIFYITHLQRECFTDAKTAPGQERIKGPRADLRH